MARGRWQKENAEIYFGRGFGRCTGKTWDQTAPDTQRWMRFEERAICSTAIICSFSDRLPEEKLRALFGSCELLLLPLLPAPRTFDVASANRQPRLPQHACLSLFAPKTFYLSFSLFVSCMMDADLCGWAGLDRLTRRRRIASMHLLSACSNTGLLFSFLTHFLLVRFFILQFPETRRFL